MALQTQTLVTQHQHLVGLVTQISNLNPAKDAAAIADLLGKFQTALIAHLETEDRDLYPALRDAAGQPDAPLSLKTNVNQFFDEMAGIKPVVVAFLGKWNAGTIGTDPAGFTTELGGIVEALGGRISREESRLYPLYDKHVAAVGV